MKTSDYPKSVWSNSINEQLNLVRTNMTQEELAKFKNQFTSLIMADLPAVDVRKCLLINYLSRKYNIKPTFNPVREHWLIRLVNDFVDGKISNIEEYVERIKREKNETEI